MKINLFFFLESKGHQGTKQKSAAAVDSVSKRARRESLATGLLRRKYKQKMFILK